MKTVFSYLPTGFICWLVCLFQDALACKIMRICPSDQKLEPMEIEKIISEMAEPKRGGLILC